MTDIKTQIAELEALLEKATPGPWKVKVGDKDDPISCDLRIVGEIYVLAEIQGPQYAHCQPNFNLIAAARNLLPTLLQSLKDKDAEIERLRDEVVDLWHNSSSTRPDLRRHLGMTFEEYSKWLTGREASDE